MTHFKTAALCLLAASIIAPAATAHIARYQILGRFHQPAATNREEADITVIRCPNLHKYHIYGYYRENRPNYRAIDPPNWGTPLGGGDHERFEEAVVAACG